MNMSAPEAGLRRVVRLVALLNLSYFGVEFAVASAIGSVSLFADSIDFLEDASSQKRFLLPLRFRFEPFKPLGKVLA
jgi:Co/Zn/Cd efflux system component